MSFRNSKTAAITMILAMQMVLLPMAMAGDLEPSAGPQGTMKSLQEIYDKLEAMDGKIDVCAGCTVAPVAATGVTVTYNHGDDGEYEKGVVSPSPRFFDNGDGTVTDKLTGLIWLRNAGCQVVSDAQYAIDFCNTLSSGRCGLTDGSVEEDWRLPNRFELESLLDLSQPEWALPSGHPFTGVYSNYWTSTAVVNYEPLINEYFWYVDMMTGIVDYSISGSPYSVWPVRGKSGR